MYLRVTFPLRTDSHYRGCLEAKQLQLAPEFQAKLGWLTTLVFGRVATKDFDASTRKGFARQYIDGIDGIEWLKRNTLANEAKMKGLESRFDRLDAATLTQLISEIDKKSHPEAVADMIADVAWRIWPDDEDKLHYFRHRLLNDSGFRATFSE